MTTIAVLGTGIMGAPIARNLAAAGFDVRAWNRTAAKAQPLASVGVAVETDPADAVRGADVVLTMLADADAVTATMESATAGLADGQVWVQASTVGIEGTRRLQELADKHGLTYVDAPVLGTKQPAEKGELTVLASGPADVRAQLDPVFDAIGTTTRWLGEAGRGTRLKLVLNSWVLALTTATAKASALADGLGFEPADFLGAIAGGPLDNAYAQLKGKAMIAREFPASFPVWGAAKDAGLIVDAGEENGVRMKVAAAVRDQMTAAVEAGYGDDDMAAVFVAAAGRTS